MKTVLISIFSLAIVLSLSTPAAGQAGSNKLNWDLMLAAQAGDAATVRQLLDKGANIDFRDDDGNTVLINAAQMGHTEVVKLLLDKGANIDAKNNNGQTALYIAELSSEDETAKLLRARGAH